MTEDKRQFAVIYYDTLGRIIVSIDPDGIRGLSGHDVVAGIDGSISTWKDIKRDLIAAATPPAAVHLESMASTTH